MAAALMLPVAARAQAPGTTPADSGLRLFASRRYADARQQLVAAWKNDQHDARSARYLGEISLLEGNGDEAARWMERAAAIDPRDANVQWGLGRAYARQASHAGRFRQLSLAGGMHQAFDRAIAIDPGHLDARLDLLRFLLVAPGFAGGGVDKAAGQAREIARRSAWRGHVAAGLVAEKKKDYARAESEMRAATAAAPDSAEAIYALGEYLERRGQTDRAVAAYEALLVRDSTALRANYHIGRAASLTGQNLERGARALEAYLAHPQAPDDPSLASAWYRLGIVYQRQGAREPAKRAFERTVALDPKQDEARAALAKLR